MSLVKNVVKRTGKNGSKNLSGKYSQKRLNQAKRSATDALKTSHKRVIQKTAEATDDLFDHKIPKRTSKVSKNSPKNNSKTVINEHDKEIPKKRRRKDKKLLMI